MHPLDPLTLNLHGQILIEASAGTGKTYTIALLFLRLLLEKGLNVDEILVVTFTKAATEELRDRIRQRIRDTLDALEDQGGQQENDRPLQELLAKITTKISQEKAKILLSDALTRMDEAAIYTIHGFCQRMLQEHAFESGAPFALEFLESEQILRKRIMEDFWRKRFYPATEEEAAWVVSLWQSPQDLLDKLGGHLGRQDLQCLPAINPKEVEQQEARLAALFVQAQEQWQAQGDNIVALLRENKRLSRDKRKGYGLARLEAAEQLLTAYLAPSSPSNPSSPSWLLAAELEELELFTTSKIESSLKKNKHDPPSHPFFTLFDDLVQAHRRLHQARKTLVLLEARTWLQDELRRRKQANDQLSFDDLLTQLDTALQGNLQGNLQGDLQGEGGKRLAQRLAQSIGQRFPIIMVDEFQDTDPLQYRIFAAIHRATQATQGTISGLFLIGDPKQAIYSFRGADIFTYIQARQDTLPANRLTMTTNYRSATPMVEAVNSLFRHKAPFLFSKDTIDFPQVKASGLADTTSLLLEDSQPSTLSPLTCLLLPEEEKGKPLAKKKAEELAARLCAYQIADLLVAGQCGTAKLGEQPLSAGDFAVLVRTHAEASLIRKELRALAITSVSFSQESVFASKEARQLLTVLTALHDLSDTALVRTALVTELFGYTAERLEHLRNDEQAWEELMRLLIAYRQLWQQQGILPMLQKLLKEQQTVSRLQMPSQPGNTNGERALTNFLHLAELLQEEARYHLGTHGANALLRWFSDQMHCPEKNAEKQQLRLESDEHLVKIVTIHKAKGMEYPMVFLPFLWAARPCSDKMPFSFHQKGQLFLDLGSESSENSKHFALAEKERLAEDLRLLYVAMTRARACCFFCWGRVSKMEQSALCYLLHNGLPAPKEPDQVLAALQKINKGNSSRELITVKPFPESFTERFTLAKLQDSASTTQLSTLFFKGKVDTRWQLTSYSRLISLQTTEPERPDHDEKADKEPEPVPAGNRSSPSSPVTLNAFCFPKGAAAGTCLHAILEKISLSDATGHETVISTELARAGFEQSWSPVVALWIQDILATNLETSQTSQTSRTNPPYALAAVQEHDRVNEMAFYFPLQSLQLKRFNQILEQFSYPGLPLPYLPNQQSVLEGLMVGFIDLVFSMHGRYYLADYKSNYLGNQPTAYQQPQLQAAMLEHRYDVQYLIYTLALHRFLRGRIKTYHYDEHFGGAFYLFLRGMHPDYTPGTGVFAARPPFALINALDQAVGNSRTAVHA